jgi:hydrogenase maturation factor
VKRNSGLPGEFELIARYFAPLARAFPGAYGLLDAAVIAPAPGHELVPKTDAFVGGHFLPTHPPDLVAQKALRVNLSDLAAKGAIARAYMLDLMLPNTIAAAWIARFAQGLARDQIEYSVQVGAGIRDVVNTLGVEPPEEDSSDAISEALRLVLDRDPGVHAGGICVGASDGVITLERTSPTESERAAAEHDAWCLFGVRDVVNRLAVCA